MRAFLSSSPILALFLTVALPFSLAGCNEEKEKKSTDTQKESTTKAKAEAPKTDEKKSVEAKPAEAKVDAKNEAPKASGQNFKLDQDADEPALKTLAKLDPKQVVARVEGDEITVAQLIDALKAAPDQVRALPLSKVYISMVKRLRDMRALVDAANKAGVDKIPEVQKKMQEASEAVKVKYFVDEKLNAKITPEFLKKQFDEFMKIYKKAGKSEKEFRLMVTIVKDKAAAEALLARAKKGEKFEDLVALSTDDKVKETKGELGYVRFSELPKDLAEKIQKAAAGVVIDSAVELGKDKWAVFKKMDQRDVPDPTFEEVAPDLKKVVMPQFFAEVLTDVLKDTKSELIDYKTGLPMDEKAEEAKAKAAAEEMAKSQTTADSASTEATAPESTASSPEKKAEAAPATEAKK